MWGRALTFSGEKANNSGKAQLYARNRVMESIETWSLKQGVRGGI
jgi:hypothetical protein